MPTGDCRRSQHFASDRQGRENVDRRGRSDGARNDAGCPTENGDDVDDKRRRGEGGELIVHRGGDGNGDGDRDGDGDGDGDDVDVDVDVGGNEGRQWRDCRTRRRPLRHSPLPL